MIAPPGGLTLGTQKAQRTGSKASQVTVTNVACTIHITTTFHSHLSGLLGSFLPLKSAGFIGVFAIKTASGTGEEYVHYGA